MAVTALLYGKLWENQFGSSAINWSSDTIKVALATSTYTPNQDTHDFFNDVTNEVTGTGYTAGGATLGSKTATYTSGTNTCAFDAADTSWTTSTITARYAIIYKSTGTASTSPLIGYVDFGADVSSSGGTFSITWDSAGIFTLTVA
jgi:hypothetical protein